MGSRLGNASRRSRWAAATLALVIFALVSACPAAASTWSVTKLRDDGVLGPLFAVACPTVQLCVVGGSDSLIATSTNPMGGRSAWSVVHPGGREEIEAPGGEGGIIFPGAQIRGISCPTEDLCIGVSLDDRVFSSTDPTGGAAAWKVTPLSGEKEPHTHMTGISCPSPALCIAVAYGSKIVRSTDPTGDASAWTEIELPERLDFRGVSCPTASFCAAVDNEGAIAISTDPAGPASAWQVVGRPGGTGSLNGVSCPTPSFCLTGNAGQMITSTNPSGGLSSWKAVVAGTGLPVKGVSCPLVSACAAVDNNSDAIVSREPTGGAAAWSFENVIPAPTPTSDGGQNGMFGISCPTTELCAAVGASEQIITSRDPFAADQAERHGGKRRLRVLITHHPAKRVNPRKGGTRVTFRFRATAKGARFRCRVDARRFRSCRSPKRYRVGKGKHAFRVLAISPMGVKSRPAVFSFRVGRLIERKPVGSCRKPPGFPPGMPFDPCISAR